MSCLLKTALVLSVVPVLLGLVQSRAYAEVAPGAKEAQLTFDQCSAAVGNHDSDVYYDSTRTARVARIEGADQTDDVCISLDSCNWRIRAIAKSVAMQMPAIQPDDCDSALRDGPFGRYRRTECHGPRIDKQLSSLSVLLHELVQSPGKLCSIDTLEPSASHLVTVSGSNFVAVSARPTSNGFCLTFAIRLLSPGLVALFTPSCISETTTWTDLLQVNPIRSVQTGSTWLAGVTSQGGFGIELSSVDAFPLSGRSAVWGWPTRQTSDYLDRWMRSVADAAASQTSLDIRMNLFPPASAQSFVGRASRWIVAGIEQTAAPHFSGTDLAQQRIRSNQASTWMARQVLKNPELSGTYLRGELAIGETEFK